MNNLKSFEKMFFKLTFKKHFPQKQRYEIY